MKNQNWLANGDGAAAIRDYWSYADCEAHRYGMEPWRKDQHLSSRKFGEKIPLGLQDPLRFTSRNSSQVFG